MSVVDRLPAVPEGETLDDLPRFDLQYLFDDPDDPSEVTVYSTDDDVTTAWISAGVDHAVPLEEVR